MDLNAYGWIILSLHIGVRLNRNKIKFIKSLTHILTLESLSMKPYTMEPIATARRFYWVSLAVALSAVSASIALLRLVPLASPRCRVWRRCNSPRCGCSERVVPRASLRLGLRWGLTPLAV